MITKASPSPHSELFDSEPPDYRPRESALARLLQLPSGVALVNQVK